MTDVPSEGFSLASAFVSVSPDTEGFQGELEAELSGVDTVIQVPVVPDTSDFRAQMDAAVGESDTAVSVPVVPDVGDFRQQVDAAIAGTGGAVEVPVVPDAAGFADKVAAEVDGTKAAVEVPVVPDAAGFADAVESEVAGTKAAVEVPVVPDAAGFAAQVESEVAGTKAAVEVPVIPDAAGFEEKVAAEAEAAKAEAVVPIVPGDLDEFKAKTVAGADSAALEASPAFGGKFSSAVGGMPLFGPASENLAKDATVAGEASAAGFGGRFAGQIEGSIPPLVASVSGQIEGTLPVAGEEAATGFMARFTGMLGSGRALVAGIIPGMEAEGTVAGDAAGTDAGEGFSKRFASILGGADLMEMAVGAAAIAIPALLADKFQEAMTRIVTQAGVAKSALGGLESGVLALSGEVGMSPDSLAAALYHVESSFQSTGITGAKALDILKVGAEGARVGGSDLVDTQNALDAAIVSGIGGVTNYSQAMGALNAIVGSGDMTMQNLAQAMGTGIMAVAKTFGQNIDQVGAALATLGDNNIRGAKAATGLRMSWQALLVPIKAGDPLLEHIGLTATALGTTLEHSGMTASIQEFVQHLQDSKVPVSDWGQYITQIFGKRAGVAIGIFVDQLARLQGKLPDIEHGAGDFATAWATTQATLSQRLHELEASFVALGTKIGLALLPVISQVAQYFVTAMPVVERFAGDLLKVVNPVVTDFLRGLGTILHLALGPLRDLTVGLAAYAVVIKGVALATAAYDAMTPFGWVMLAAAGFVLLTGVMNKFKGPLPTIAIAIGAVTLAWIAFNSAVAMNPLVLFGIVALAAYEVINRLHGPLKIAAEAVAGLTAAVWLMNIAWDANPVGAVILAITALSVAFYEAWEKSAAFRNVIKDLAAGILGMGLVVVQGLKAIVTGVLAFFGSIINGAAAAFGWVPGIGPKLKAAAKSFDSFQSGVNNSFNSMIGTMKSWQSQLTAGNATAEKTTAQIKKDFEDQQRSADSARTSLDKYSSSIKDNGINSSQAQAARQQLVKDLTNAGVKAPAAQAAVAKYTAAVKDNGLQSSQAKTARAQLVTDILNVSKNAAQGKADIADLTTAIQHHGAVSSQAHSARAQLYNDLVNAGVAADTARTYVANLVTALSKVKSPPPVTISINTKVTDVGSTQSPSVPGSTQATQQAITKALSGHASGGLIPGYAPGHDTVAAMLSPGEFVVVPEAVKALGAGYFTGINQRYSKRPGAPAGAGYAAGGPVSGGAAAVSVTAPGGASLKAQAVKDAKDVGDEWAKSSAKWFSAAQDAVKTQVTDQLTKAAGTDVPAAWAKSVPTWYDTHPAALNTKVTAPVTTLVNTTIPAAFSKTVPTWYDTHPAALNSKVTAPVTTLVNTTIPGAFSATIPKWYDAHAAALNTQVAAPVKTFVNTTVPAAWNATIPHWFTTVAPLHATQVQAPLNTYYKTTLPTAITTGFTGAMTQVGVVANKDISALNAVTKVGGITPVAALSFALGGVMPGYEPGKDTMPIMVGGGEGILVPEAVRGIGGAGTVHALNRKFAGHRGAGYAAGGVTGSSVASYATGVKNLYTWGGAAPPATDCSGFSAAIYEHFGLIPAKPGSRWGTSETQFTSPLLTPASEQPGAMVFFAGSDGTNSAPGHVGISLGGGKYVGADGPEGASNRIEPESGNLGFRVPKQGWVPGGVLGQLVGAMVKTEPFGGPVAAKAGGADALISAGAKPVADALVNASGSGYALGGTIPDTLNDLALHQVKGMTEKSVTAKVKAEAAALAALASGGNSGAVGSVGSVGAGATAFVDAVLKAIGAPVNGQTTGAMLAWGKAEGGGYGTENQANYNPWNLNPGGGAGWPGHNASGAWSFPNAADGAYYTAKVISQSNFSGIGSALRAGKSEHDILEAVVNSGWAASRYAGDAEMQSALANTAGGATWYADGGVIPEPVIGYGVQTGRKYGFGENGPETVVPGVAGGTGAAGGGKGGGTVVNFNYYGPSAPTPEQQQALFLKASAMIGVS